MYSCLFLHAIKGTQEPSVLHLSIFQLHWTFTLSTWEEENYNHIENAWDETPPSWNYTFFVTTFLFFSKQNWQSKANTAKNFHRSETSSSFGGEQRTIPSSTMFFSKVSNMIEWKCIRKLWCSTFLLASAAVSSCIWRPSTVSALLPNHEEKLHWFIWLVV